MCTSDKVVERFGAPGILEQNEASTDLSVTNTAYGVKPVKEYRPAGTAE